MPNKVTVIQMKNEIISFGNIRWMAGLKKSDWKPKFQNRILRKIISLMIVNSIFYLNEYLMQNKDI